ncbi:hypothetical protein [Dyadobacter sp. MSC1_007]|jgi:hypothetical protein|uniref:hypothetical protein n=1 Tax=Dyadobacter sp. MSC1_007 TaxID=2909264 RepID=UPI00202FD91F|nr:hypothetical protein [Dyadobacter sp. MSC1_007]
MDKEIYIRNLSYKYISGQCTEEEQDEIFTHLQTPVGKWVFDEVMNSETGKIFAASQEIDPEISNRIFNRLQESIEVVDQVEKRIPILERSGFKWMKSAWNWISGIF